MGLKLIIGNKLRPLGPSLGLWTTTTTDIHLPTIHKTKLL